MFLLLLYIIPTLFRSFSHENATTKRQFKYANVIVSHYLPIRNFV